MKALNYYTCPACSHPWSHVAQPWTPDECPECTTIAEPEAYDELDRAEEAAL